MTDKYDINFEKHIVNSQPGSLLSAYDASQERIFSLIDRLKFADRLLRKYANHKEACRCFICRTLSDEDRAVLRHILSSPPMRWSLPE